MRCTPRVLLLIIYVVLLVCLFVVTPSHAKRRRHPHRRPTTKAPSASPLAAPTSRPTPVPTQRPTALPSRRPTTLPTNRPTRKCAQPSIESGYHSLVTPATALSPSLKRYFQLYIPPSLANSTPHDLVLMFHGWAGTSSDYIYPDSPVRQLAKARGFVVAVPDGLSDVQVNQGRVWRKERSWAVPGATSGLGADGAPTCNVLKTNDLTFNSCVGEAANTCSWVHCMADDVAFTVQLVKYLQAVLCIDKVFAYGGSNGGMLVWELGSNAASAPLFTALASVAGLPMHGVVFGKASPTDLPMLLVTGMEDTHVPPGAWGQLSPTQSPVSSGLVNFFTSATAAVKRWSAQQQQQGCGATSMHATQVPGASAGMACRTFCTNAKVIDCRLATGDHAVVYGAIATTVNMAFGFFAAQDAA